MTFEMPERPPEGTSLRWLNRTLMGLCWMIAVITVVGSAVYILSTLSYQFSRSGTSYDRSLGYMVGTVCGMLATGGITALFLLGLTKWTQIWAEMLDNGRQKTDLLATLLTNPTPHD